MSTAHKLVNITLVDSRIIVDLRYATPHNITNRVLYTSPTCYLHEDAAMALKRVQDKLSEQGLFLKIFDGYRPLRVQQFIWDLIQDERYVANPANNKGRHTRGTAVDVTLIDIHGNELEMPSPFDDFTERAHRTNTDMSVAARSNMMLLEKAMEAENFVGWPLEWWHYDVRGWNDDVRYPPLDVILP